MVNDLSANPVRLHLMPLPRAADPETGDAQLFRGALVGSLSTGIRRSPARASAPASPSLPGECAVGLDVGSGTPSDPAGVDTASLPFPPFCGQGRPQRTVAAGATPSLAAAVDQVGAS